METAWDRFSSIMPTLYHILLHLHLLLYLHAECRAGLLHSPRYADADSLQSAPQSSKKVQTCLICQCALKWRGGRGGKPAWLALGFACTLVLRRCGGIGKKMFLAKRSVKTWFEGSTTAPPRWDRWASSWVCVYHPACSGPPLSWQVVVGGGNAFWAVYECIQRLSSPYCNHQNHHHPFRHTRTPGGVKQGPVGIPD